VCLAAEAGKMRRRRRRSRMKMIWRRGGGRCGASGGK
jgi:hypothetical protein